MKKYLFVWFLVITTLVLVGCGSRNAGDEVIMDEPVPAGAEDALMVELEFSAEEIIPNKVTIPAGKEVLFVVYNSDTEPGDLNEDHNLVAPDIGLKEILVVPGQTARRLWDGYDVPGEYRAGCTIHSWIDMTIEIAE